MGKANIISNQGEGLYTVQPVYGGDVAARSASLQAQATDLTARIEAEQAKADGYDAPIQAIDGRIADLSAELAALTSSPDPGAIWNPDAEEEDQITIIQRAEVVRGLITAQMEQRQPPATQRANHNRQADLLRLQRESISLEAANFSSLSTQHAAQSMPAWCADYSDDLTGTVGTIELNGEPGGPVILAPQARGLGENLPSGILTPVTAMSPAQAVLNFAIHPGWQRHKPMYRSAMITAVYPDTDTCDIWLLESEKKSHYGTNLPINPQDAWTMHGVPVEYMNCNAKAFNELDDVVVEFRGQNWSEPVVVGFVEEPERCVYCEESDYSLSVAAENPLPPGHERASWYFVSVLPSLGSHVINPAFSSHPGNTEFYIVRDIMAGGSLINPAFVQLAISTDGGTGWSPRLNDTGQLSGEDYPASQVNTCSKTVLANKIKIQIGSHEMRSGMAQRLWVFVKRTAEHIYIGPGVKHTSSPPSLPDAPEGALGADVVGSVSSPYLRWYQRMGGAWVSVSVNSEAIKSRVCWQSGAIGLNPRPIIHTNMTWRRRDGGAVIDSNQCLTASQWGGGTWIDNYKRWRKPPSSVHGTSYVPNLYDVAGYVETGADGRSASSPCPNVENDCLVGAINWHSGGGWVNFSSSGSFTGEQVSRSFDRTRDMWCSSANPSVIVFSHSNFEVMVRPLQIQSPILPLTFIAISDQVHDMVPGWLLSGLATRRYYVAIINE